MGLCSVGLVDVTNWLFDLDWIRSILDGAGAETIVNSSAVMLICLFRVRVWQSNLARVFT